jgi:hypothetical protein
MGTKTKEQDCSTSDQPVVGAASGKKGDSSFSEEDRTPVEEMTTLGQCRYCENEATRMAPHKDGTGWIAICEDHEKEARSDDFRPEKEEHASVS